MRAHQRRQACLRVLLAVVLIVAFAGLRTLRPDAQPPKVQDHSAPAAPAPHAVRFGIAFGDTLLHASGRHLREGLADVVKSGARWARVDLSWADVQPTGPSTWDWSGFDRLARAASTAGVQLLATIGYTPAWARVPGCVDAGCAPAHSDDFVSFARAAAYRYRSSVRTWEVWNEPNTSGFWAPAPNARAYTTLLAGTAAAIHAVQPQATVISGGLAATLSRPGAIDTRAFLRTMCSFGANRVVDAIGYHPYTYPYLAGFRASFDTAWTKISLARTSIRDILSAAGTPHLPIWATEFGAPTKGIGTAADGKGTPGPTTDHVTTGLQAQIASDVVGTARVTPGVRAVFWYSDRDERGTGNQYYYGLRYRNGSPKPAWSAWRSAVRAAG